MAGRTIQRVLRSAFLWGMLVTGAPLLASAAQAGISLHGGSEESREHLAGLIASQWGADETRDVDLAITIGTTALAEYCSGNHQSPVLAIYLYESRFEEAKADCAQPVAAIFSDAPLLYQVRLARGLFPGSRSAMLTSERATGEPVPEKTADILLPIPEEGVAKGLGRLIAEGQWDVFLLPIDALVFKGSDYRLSLETLFRHRKPAIVSINQLLSQGAAATVYYTSTQLDQAVVEALDRLIETGELTGTRPDRVTVGINKTVMRNLYGRVIPPEVLRALEAEVNGD